MEANGNAATLNIQNYVSELEIIGCEIVKGYSNAVVIADGQTVTIDPLHLYTHNYIRGRGDVVRSRMRHRRMRTIAFHQNTVFGDVGTINGQVQRHSNNTSTACELARSGRRGRHRRLRHAIFNKARNLPDSWND